MPDILEQLEELMGERELVINSSKGKDMATIRRAMFTIEQQRKALSTAHSELETMLKGHIDKPALRKLLKELANEKSNS